jgi:hypothetical protein
MLNQQLRVLKERHRVVVIFLHMDGTNQRPVANLRNERASHMAAQGALFDGGDVDETLIQEEEHVADCAQYVAD